MKKLNIKEENLGDLNYWEVLFKTKEEDFKKLKKQTKRDLLSIAYEKSPDSIRLNKDWAIKAVTDFQINFSSLDERIKDKEFCIRYIEEYEYPSTFAIPEKYQSDLFEKTIIKCEWSLRDIFYNKNLKHLNTKENICKWVAQNANIYKELEKTSYRNDFTIAEIAVKKDLNLLFKMNKSIAKKIISRNLEMMLEFFTQDGRVFPMLPLKIRNNKEFILKHIDKIDYKNVSYIGKEALNNKEILLKLKTFYNVIIPEIFLTDKEVVYHVIREEGYVRKEFNDCEIFTIVELIKTVLLETKSANMYKYLASKYRINSQIISVFLEIGYFKELIKVQKNSFGHVFETNELIDVSVVKLLDENIKKDLISEYQEITNTQEVPEEKELLYFARNRYLKIILNEKLENKLKIKALKI